MIGMTDWAVLTLKRRHIDPAYRTYRPPEYFCDRCDFISRRVTTAYVHAFQVHGDRTSPPVGASITPSESV